jgi:hypothetical protein
MKLRRSQITGLVTSRDGLADCLLRDWALGVRLGGQYEPTKLINLGANPLVDQARCTAGLSCAAAVEVTARHRADAAQRSRWRVPHRPRRGSSPAVERPAQDADARVVTANGFSDLPDGPQ